MDKITIAAKMAGEWWADKLDAAHADKKEAFANAVSTRVEQALRGQYHWDWFGKRSDGNGQPIELVQTECDYDPNGLLLEAIQETVNSNCRGFLFSASGILPEKHKLIIKLDFLEPKEGYGNWKDPIKVEVE
jgi:hypothetical protein